MSSMKKTVFVILALAVASVAQAQTLTAQPPIDWGSERQQLPPAHFSSWIIGADFAPAGVVKTSGLLQPIGSVGSRVVGGDDKSDFFVNAFLAYKPIGKFGGEVGVQSFGAHNNLTGTIGQDEGRLTTWGPDATPKVVTSPSSPPVLYGPVGYSQNSSAKFSRFNALVNYTFNLPKGWLSVKGGGTILQSKSSEDLVREQNILLYSLDSNRNLSSVAIKERYGYSSTATEKSTRFGLAIGADGEYCVVGNLSAQGALLLSRLPWGGGSQLAGQFTAVKDIYLTNTSGGLTGTPTQTLAHLNWAPTAVPYSETVKQTVTAVDLKVGLKWRIGSANIGLAVSRSSLSNMSTAPAYVIGDPYAVGYGKFTPRSASMSVWSPVLTVGFWF